MNSLNSFTYRSSQNQSLLLGIFEAVDGGFQMLLYKFYFYFLGRSKITGISMTRNALQTKFESLGSSRILLNRGSSLTVTLYYGTNSSETNMLFEAEWGKTEMKTMPWVIFVADKEERKAQLVKSSKKNSQKRDNRPLAYVAPFVDLHRRESSRND